MELRPCTDGGGIRGRTDRVSGNTSPEQRPASPVRMRDLSFRFTLQATRPSHIAVKRQPPWPRLGHFLKRSSVCLAVTHRGSVHASNPWAPGSAIFSGAAPPVGSLYSELKRVFLLSCGCRLRSLGQIPPVTVSQACERKSANPSSFKKMIENHNKPLQRHKNCLTPQSGPSPLVRISPRGFEKQGHDFDVVCKRD